MEAIIDSLWLINIECGVVIEEVSSTFLCLKFLKAWKFQIQIKFGVAFDPSYQNLLQITDLNFKKFSKSPQFLSTEPLHFLYNPQPNISDL